VCNLFTPHTTCAVTILTNEEGIAEDLLTVSHGLVPQTTAYRTTRPITCAPTS